MNSALGKLLYGALFTVALPVLLVVWAIETRDLVKLPAIHSMPWGIGTIAVGSLLVALGMASLWRVGGGLPMNAFPPPRYVSSGIYSLFSHPIYLGFSLVCIGSAIAAGSRQWFVAGLPHRWLSRAPRWCWDTNCPICRDVSAVRALSNACCPPTTNLPLPGSSAFAVT